MIPSLARQIYYTTCICGSDRGFSEYHSFLWLDVVSLDETFATFRTIVVLSSKNSAED
jgi:hypothetical protein